LKDRFKQIAKITIFLGLSILLLCFAFRNVKIREIFFELKTARYSWLILSVALSMLAFFSRARRWVLMIRPLGYRPSLPNAYHAIMTGYLMNLALPRLGEVSKCVALGKKEKIPVDKLVGTVIVERTVDLISLFIILLIMLFLRGDLMRSFLKEDLIDPVREKLVSFFGFSTLFMTSVIILILLLIFAAYQFREQLMRNRFVARLARFLKGVVNGLRSFYTMENKFEFIFHTIFIWVNYILMSWVIVFMIPATAHLTFADATFILVIGSLGMAAPVQGGIGAFHWIVSRGLYAVYNINLEEGLAYATLAHESQLILIALLGTISFYSLLRNRKRSPTSPLTDMDNGQK